jgi:predicted Zn-dependent peptidase
VLVRTRCFCCHYGFLSEAKTNVETICSLQPNDCYQYRLPTLSPQPSKATSISVSTLPNGLKVITEDAGTSSTVTLTYPKAGSANEMIYEQGAAYVNKHMNFKSGSGISTLAINRTIEDAGGTPFTIVDRYGATLGYTVTPEKALGLIPLLATDCTFEKWDVRDAKEAAVKESDIANESAQIVLTENLHAAAFGPQSSAGRPLYGIVCTNDVLKSFRARTYGLNGAVLTATGVKDHSAFCTEAANLLSESPVGNVDPIASITYLGGESRVSAPSTGYAHVALGFAVPSSSVVTDVIVQFLTLSGMEVGVTGFSTKGIIGVYAGSESTTTLIDNMVATMKATISSSIIQRAKNLAKAEALFALDGGSKSMASVLTASVLNSTVLASAAEVSTVYDAVTDKQVTDALLTMFKCNPSLAAVGDISLVPYQATVAAMLK